MNGKTRFRLVINLLLWIGSFIVSTYSMSNMMPLILRVATRATNYADWLAILGYSLATLCAMLVLARGIYRLDKRSGRIRNKVGWFE